MQKLTGKGRTHSTPAAATEASTLAGKNITKAYVRSIPAVKVGHTIRRPCDAVMRLDIARPTGVFAQQRITHVKHEPIVSFTSEQYGCSGSW
jgi:hypothetical protein